MTASLRRVAFSVIVVPVLCLTGVMLLLDYLVRFGWWMAFGIDPEGCTWTWEACRFLSSFPDYVRDGQWPVL